MALSSLEIINITMIPDIFISAPIAKDIIEHLELFFRESPVCKPITETNKDVPSFEKVFNALCAFVMISALPSWTKHFNRKPTSMEVNKTPAIPIEIPFTCILPIVRPITIIKNRRLSGEKSIVRKSIIVHRNVAYAEDGYHDIASGFYQSVYLRDSARRTTPRNQASFQVHRAISLWNGQYPA